MLFTYQRCSFTTPYVLFSLCLSPCLFLSDILTSDLKPLVYKLLWFLLYFSLIIDKIFSTSPTPFIWTWSSSICIIFPFIHILTSNLKLLVYKLLWFLLYISLIIDKILSTSPTPSVWTLSSSIHIIFVFILIFILGLVPGIVGAWCSLWLFSPFLQLSNSSSTVLSLSMSIWVQPEIYLCVYAFLQLSCAQSKVSWQSDSLQTSHSCQDLSFQVSLTIFLLSYSFPSYFQHAIHFRWSRPTYVCTLV